MFPRNQIIDEISFLENKNGTKRNKYRRNLRCYYHTYGFGMTNIDDSSVAGYYSSNPYDTEEDTSSGIQENIIKSCVDTLTSKIASQKARPFFNTVDATPQDMRLVRHAQQYFDNFYDENNVNKVITDAFKDSCIFDTGVIYVDRDSKTVRRVMPWQISIDNREAAYGNITKIVWKRDNYPVSLINFQDKKLSKAFREETQDCTYYTYWNLNKGIVVDWIPEADFYKESVWEPETIPFIFLNYDEPIKGSSSVSIVDMLWGIQSEIDSLIVKIKDASQLASPLKYFIPTSSDIKVNKLSNRVGEVITYTTMQGMPPIEVATEPFMDPQWIQLLDKLKQDAYELCGITQLSATGQKPQGINSGVGLTTLEDIEDTRFETQLNQVIKCYTDLAKLCIEIFDPNEEILPSNRLRKSFKWCDLVEAKDQIIIQFSAAEQLSKDPQTRATQVQMLVQMGVIPQNRIASLMEIPDSVQGYSLAQNALNATIEVIDEWLDGEITEIPIYVSTDMIMDETQNTMLSLKASGKKDDDEDIMKLNELYQLCIQKKQDEMTNAEMTATMGIAAELDQDIQNPNGQINMSINNAINSNSIGEQQNEV